LDVHQHDVGMAAAGEVDGIAAITGLADDVDAGLFLQDRSEPGPDEGLIVGDQNRDRPFRLLVGFGHAGTVDADRARRIIPGSQAEIILGGDGACGERAYGTTLCTGFRFGVTIDM
jgi:hypothetical protein